MREKRFVLKNPLAPSCPWRLPIWSCRRQRQANTVLWISSSHFSNCQCLKISVAVKDHRRPLICHSVTSLNMQEECMSVRAAPLRCAGQKSRSSLSFECHNSQQAQIFHKWHCKQEVFLPAWGCEPFCFFSGPSLCVFLALISPFLSHIARTFLSVSVTLPQVYLPEGRKNRCWLPYRDAHAQEGQLIYIDDKSLCSDADSPWKCMFHWRPEPRFVFI